MKRILFTLLMGGCSFRCEVNSKAACDSHCSEAPDNSILVAPSSTDEEEDSTPTPVIDEED